MEMELFGTMEKNSFLWHFQGVAQGRERDSVARFPGWFRVLFPVTFCGAFWGGVIWLLLRP